MDTQPLTNARDLGRNARLEVNHRTPVEPAPTTIGWPDALRLHNDAEATSHNALESELARLLGLGHAALGGGSLGARFSIEQAGAELTALGCPDDVAVTLSRVQEHAESGPSLECERLAKPVFSGRVVEDQRWTALAGAAADAGIRSVAAVPLLGERQCIGSLSCYSPDAYEEFPSAFVATLEALAAHVSVLLCNAAVIAASNRTIEQMREAMLSRSIIEQAKGVLMARENIDAETAWEYLVRISQRTHRKLRDISVDVVSKASGGTLTS